MSGASPTVAVAGYTTSHKPRPGSLKCSRSTRFRRSYARGEAPACTRQSLRKPWVGNGYVLLERVPLTLGIFDVSYLAVLLREIVHQGHGHTFDLA